MITVKEEFLTCAKTVRAIQRGGYEVLALWLAMKAYASVNLTDGFVPDEDIETMPGAPKRARKSLTVLVECGKKNQDGSRGHGLVDQVDGGWQLHDYLDHAKSRDEIELRREQDRQRKRSQRMRNRAELERMKSGVHEESRTMSRRDTPRDTPRDTMVESRRPSRSPSLACARATSQPSPAQPKPKAAKQSPKDLNRGAQLAGQNESAAPPEIDPGRPLTHPDDPTPGDHTQSAPQTPPRVSNRPSASNLSEALALDPKTRARQVERDPHLADWLVPEQWPELLAIAEDWGETRLGTYARDSGVRALVSLLAAGYTEAELRKAAANIRASAWAARTMASGSKLGLASMTLESVRRALAETPALRPAKDFETRQREREIDNVAKVMAEARRLNREVAK